MPYNHFFIVGCPRSGTTLLQQALNRHSQVVIPPETGFFSLVGASRAEQRLHLRRLSEDLGIDINTQGRRICGIQHSRTLFCDIARKYVDKLERHGVTHFGEKTPEHLYRLGRIHRIMPRSKVILIYRDGRDVALSLQRLPWTSRNLYVNFALWLYCCRLQYQAERSCELPLLSVCYEDLARNPSSELRRILRFLALPPEELVVTGKGDAGGIPEWELAWKGRATEAIGGNRIGLWRSELTEEQLNVLERWGGRWLRALGYKLETGGRQALPWFFLPRVAWHCLCWLVNRPRYGLQKALWEQRCVEQANASGAS